ncbi:MAG TPA: DUF2933 domain-containing protein [Burkholderiales bacterium]|nr:DUF2933 domain-containing protein [Burkholderiales bacterium]
MTSHDTHEKSSFWKSRTGITLCAFVAIAAVLLVLEHRAHALQWLPFALLLACPLLHLFHGHGGHGGGAQDKSDTDKRA